MKSRVRKLLNEALEAGCAIERRKKHLTITHPEVGVVAVLPLKGGDERGRGDRNTRAAIRRVGRR